MKCCHHGSALKVHCPNGKWMNNQHGIYFQLMWIVVFIHRFNVLSLQRYARTCNDIVVHHLGAVLPQQRNRSTAVLYIDA